MSILEVYKRGVSVFLSFFFTSNIQPTIFCAIQFIVRNLRIIFQCIGHLFVTGGYYLQWYSYNVKRVYDFEPYYFIVSTRSK